MILIDAERVTASRPERPLFEDLSITISDGERLGLVGLNGCGKSTLLRYLAGASAPDGGVVRRGRNVRISYLDQNPDLPDGTVHAAVGDSWEAAAVLDRLGMAELVDADVRTLSGGQAKRVALARTLVASAGETDELLILDEPTNHLDLDAIAWLEERLRVHRGGLIMVTHDRHVLDRVVNKVLEIDRGAGYIHEGGYQGYLAGRAEREARTAATEEVRRNLARKELAWLQRGAKARTRKPKAHIDAALALINGKPQPAARSGEIGLGAATSRSGEGQERSLSSQQGSFRAQYDARLAPRLGNKVVELHEVQFGWPGSERPLLRHLDWILDPGERYGIVGPNGAGKTTLLELIAGRLAPLDGRIEIGPTVQVGYYEQVGRSLDPSVRVREAVAGPARAAGTPEDKRLMEQFWFDDDLQWAEIGLLSGGERRRLQLLLVLAERPNVLLLDEPTNDLDLDTLRALEAFLDEWPGTLVVVSHDRTFLDRTVEEVLAIDETGRAALVPGGYPGWLARRGTAAATSKAPAMRSHAELATPGLSQGAGTTGTVPGASSPRSASTLRHLLKEAERDLNRLTKKRDALRNDLDANSASGDHRRLASLGTDLASVQAELDAIEERWLDLAEEATARGT